MIDRLNFRIATVATLGVAVLAAGCSGGGGQSAAPAVPATTNSKPAPAASAKTTKAKLNVRIPIRQASAKASRRTPKYVSASTNEIGVLVNGGTPGAAWQLFDVSSSASASPDAVCTVSGGFRNCAISVIAPAVDGATDTFGVTATDQSPAAGDTIPQGNYLSTGYATATVVAGTVNTVNIGLTGVIGQLSTDKAAYSIWAAPGQNATVGGSTIVNITADDFQGGDIAGTQPTFANPIVFSDTLTASSPPSPFTYPSANIAASNFGLAPPATPGAIPATITYTAPASTAPVTTTVSVTTAMPSFIPASQLNPTTTFTLNTMVVSAGTPLAPIASVPNLSVSGSDVTVTVSEIGATSFTVTPNTAAPNNDGSITLPGLPAPVAPATGSTLTATGGTATFTVHAVSPTSVAANAPTISIVDGNGTTATLTAVVGP